MIPASTLLDPNWHDERRVQIMWTGWVMRQSWWGDLTP